MNRFLIALLCLSACAMAEVPLELPPSDPLAFITPQARITLPSLNSDTTRSIDNPPITAICRDSWVSYSRERGGTCSGHRGVRRWVNRPAG